MKHFAVRNEHASFKQGGLLRGNKQRSGRISTGARLNLEGKKHVYKTTDVSHIT